MDEGLLNEYTRRRVAALLLVTGLVVGLLALADVGPFENPPTDEERVEDAVRDLHGAAAEGDFERYCELLTAAARDRIRANAARLVEEAGGLTCAGILEVAKDALAGTDARIREVSVSGNRARVEVNVKAGAGPLEPRTVELELDDEDEWKVSDAGY